MINQPVIPAFKILLLIAAATLPYACTDSADGEGVQSVRQTGDKGGKSQPIADISIGSLAPDFSTRTMESKPFKLSNYRGKFVLIDFWGTWCRPCLGEIPYLKAANRDFGRDDLQIVSIAMDDPANLKPFIAKNEMNWIHIQQDFGGPLLSLYKVTAFPTTILVDPEGTIVAMGIDLRHQNLARTLRKFISKNS
ncbi:TlpA family protein disulfide reductase [bacterium]|nr:TlpA family protein disulfide reductase [bacterium]